MYAGVRNYNVFQNFQQEKIVNKYMYVHIHTEREGDCADKSGKYSQKVSLGKGYLGVIVLYFQIL